MELICLCKKPLHQAGGSLLPEVRYFLRKWLILETLVESSWLFNETIKCAYLKDRGVLWCIHGTANETTVNYYL